MLCRECDGIARKNSSQLYLKATRSLKSRNNRPKKWWNKNSEPWFLVAGVNTRSNIAVRIHKRRKIPSFVEQVWLNFGSKWIVSEFWWNWNNSRRNQEQEANEYWRCLIRTRLDRRRLSITVLSTLVLHVTFINKTCLIKNGKEVVNIMT